MLLSGTKASKSNSVECGCVCFDCPNPLYRSKVTKGRLEQIGALLKRKAEIEEKILLHTTSLEKAYMDANQELAVTMKGRMHDISSLELKVVVVTRAHKKLQLMVIAGKLDKLSLPPRTEYRVTFSGSSKLS